jgi:hypothetical protein
MWLWCWGSCALGDPGSVKEDLRRRGLLHLIEQGEIPPCLRNLGLCTVCRLPRPKGASHCPTCGCCQLRLDHHCGVTGKCIADKNFKAFILNFFWGGCFALLLLPVGVVRLCEQVDVVGTLVTVYSVSLGFLLLRGGRRFLQMHVNEQHWTSEIADVWDLLTTFGDQKWMRFVPIQKTCTRLAWPGVDWTSERIPFM